jgi:hypothetical protein
MAQIPANAKLPDLATVIPQQLQIVNPAKGSKREVLRFSNGIANIGDGPWRMRPEFPTLDPSQPQTAIQELLDSTDSSGDIAYEAVVSQFEFHPEHNHWHIDGVALYEVRGSNGLDPPGDRDIGPIVGGNAIKTTFCLIDWVRLEGSSNNGKNTDRVYRDCFGSHQGISTANADRVFLEKDYTNNRAWVAFDLIRFSQGNAKLVIVGDSFSVEEEGLSPAYTTNR